MPPLRYAAEAVGLLGLAWGLVRWVARWARDVGEGRSASVDLLGLHEGVDSPTRLAEPPRAPIRFAAPHPVPAPRRAVGLDVFCPSCGGALARESLQTTGRTTCDGCAREVTAYIRRGRLTVIVQETAEEAERRARVDRDVVRPA